MESETAKISRLLNDFHDAASRADYTQYFNFFAEGAIFLGTDAAERWNLVELKAWAIPLFEEGRGWTYIAQQRHVYLSPDKNTAWFDECLTHEKFGECRSSGVLITIEHEWKVTQYNLTFPIPNAIAFDVVEMIQQTKHETPSGE